ncbi:MAG TPA: hypothetical protein VER17_00585 [Tepidisphaeraceae bacterium]|nr:hypothetical protein [Tepidisphaeraceae bacterium]
MKTNKLLAGVLVLQGLILLGQWTGTGYLPPAQAQLTDPANRQMQMVDELKTLNQKLDQVIDILKAGDLQVKVAKSDEEKQAKPAPAGAAGAPNSGRAR